MWLLVAVFVIAAATLFTVACVRSTRNRDPLRSLGSCEAHITHRVEQRKRDEKRKGRG
jgi:hypothetical protein